MRTLIQAALPVLAASGLSGSVAVAVGALVVVLAIVLVFVMVLRSNGAARKTAGGLGYDAQRGPLGQPQPDGGNASPWQRQSMQQAPGSPGWGQGQAGDFGGPGAPSAGRANSAAWGQTQDYPGAANSGMPGGGRWGAQGNAPANDPWQTGDGGSWSTPQAPANRPGAGMAGMNGAGGWDMPGAGGGGAPWEQAAAGASDWGAPPASAGRPGAGAGGMAGMNGGGWGAGGAGAAGMASAPAGAAEWGAPAGAGLPQQDWGGAPASRPHQDWGAPQAPQGFEVAGGYGEYGEVDKTRIARPAGPQSLGMIVVRQGKEPGRIFEVRKDRLTIGRSRESDIFLEDLAVSRLHTTVARDESGRYILRDENSANGTYVNGQRISEHVLDEGDEIQVGQTVLAFVRR